MTQTFQSFESRNYRLFFGGQTLSVIGGFITETTCAWLVYSLIESVLLLGLIGFMRQVPNLIVSPLVGVWIEQYNRSLYYWFDYLLYQVARNKKVLACSLY